MEGYHYSTFGEERKRLEKKESNNIGHANPLFDADIDLDIDDE